jgi:hypothetical protein
MPNALEIEVRLPRRNGCVIRLTAQGPHELLEEPFGLAQFAFPHDDDVPALASQFSLIRAISPLGALELGQPVPSVRRRGRGSFASSMTMPETAVNENHGSAPAEDEVRPPRKIPSVQAEPASEAMDHRSDLDLGTRVRGADLSHDPTSLLAAENIHFFLNPV